MKSPITVCVDVNLVVHSGQQFVSFHVKETTSIIYSIIGEFLGQLTKNDQSKFVYDEKIIYDRRLRLSIH